MTLLEKESRDWIVYVSGTLAVPACRPLPLISKFLTLASSARRQHGSTTPSASLGDTETEMPVSNTLLVVG